MPWEETSGAGTAHLRLGGRQGARQRQEIELCVYFYFLCIVCYCDQENLINLNLCI